MRARSWLVLTAMIALVSASGCGSVRWGHRHSRLSSQCVNSHCDDPTCEICSPLPPLYDGMAKGHRLRRHDVRRGGRHGGCTCGHCGDGEWFEGEIIEGEIIGGDCFPGGCMTCDSGCSSCDGSMMSGGMMPSSSCPHCHQQTMSGSPQMMMDGSSAQPQEMNYEPQPTRVPANTKPNDSNAPTYSPAPTQPVPPPSKPAAPPSTVPGEMAPAQPMAPGGPMPMGQPMSQMPAPNYGAALFGAAPAELASPGATPVMQPAAMIESPAPIAAPPAPPLASPAAHAQPAMPAPQQVFVPSLPTASAGSSPTASQPSDYYTPKNQPIELQSGTVTEAKPVPVLGSPVLAKPPVDAKPLPPAPGRKPMRPFSADAKPKKPATPTVAPQQWEASLVAQPVPPTSPVQQAAASPLPALPK